MKYVLILVALLAAAGCGSASPLAPAAPTYPTVQGNYSGTYTVIGCSEGAIVGFCASGNFSVGSQWPLAIALSQNQSAVNGTINLGAVNGPFVGTITSGGTLTATAGLGNLLLNGFTVLGNVTSWTTTAAGTSMSGAFIVTFRVAGVNGDAVFSGGINQLHR